MSTDTPDLNAFAAQLAALRPTVARSRDQILFEAGLRSAKRGTIWPWTSLALAGLSFWFASRPVKVIESMMFVERSEPSPTYVWSEPIDPGSYLHLRDTALRFGVEALPQPDAHYQPGTPLTSGDLNSVSN